MLQAKGIAPGRSQQLEAPRLEIDTPVPKPVAEPIPPRDAVASHSAASAHSDHEIAGLKGATEDVKSLLSTPNSISRASQKRKAAHTVKPEPSAEANSSEEGADKKDVERLEQMSSYALQMLSEARARNAASRTSAEQGDVERLERMLSDTLALLAAARAKVTAKRDRKKVKREASDVIDLT